MGGTNSKPEPKKVSTNFKNADLLDMIAAKYILTQNFKDMEKLSQKAYCDKLVILTTDVIKKFMNEKVCINDAAQSIVKLGLAKFFLMKVNKSFHI
mgnify:CR=1 FL=1